MKRNFKLFSVNVFAVAMVLTLLVSSCKKVELEDIIVSKNKNAPELAEKLAGKNPHVPVDTTSADTPPSEECGEWIGEEWVTFPCEDTTAVGDETPEEECGEWIGEEYVTYPCDTPPSTGGGTTTTSEAPTTTCPSVDYPIYAGAGGNDTTKGDNVGTVSYTNDGVNLYVTATFDGPTCPEEIHLSASSDPSAVSGNGGLPFGQFPYKMDNPGCGTHTFTIPLTDIFPSEDACGKDVYIVLHAAMSPDEDAEEGEGGQTAVGYGETEFGGSRWGWSATYPVCCD